MHSIMVIRRYKSQLISSDGGKTTSVREEGFLQICGVSTEREMHMIADSLFPLRKHPYKLRCNCQHCISYSYEDISERVFIEPFMRAINIVFNILCKWNYTIQSTVPVQNADGSSTTTWVWIKQR